MSLKRNRQPLVWIAAVILFVAAFSQIKPVSMVTLPGYGYRAYEWTWIAEFQNMMSNINGVFPNWVDPLKEAVTSEWSKQTDDNGNPIVIYDGPTTASFNWQITQYQDRQRATFDVEVHLWFYGYFPNNIPEAVPLPSIERDLDNLFDVIFPKAYAFWQFIAIIAIAICATILGYGIIQYAITHENFLLEKQRWDDIYDDPNMPPILKWLYAVIQSVLGWFQTLGPVAILAVCAIAIIFVWGGSGKKRR